MRKVLSIKTDQLENEKYCRSMDLQSLEALKTEFNFINSKCESLLKENSQLLDDADLMYKQLHQVEDDFQERLTNLSSELQNERNHSSLQVDRLKAFEAEAKLLKVARDTQMNEKEGLQRSVEELKQWLSAKEAECQVVTKIVMLM